MKRAILGAFLAIACSVSLAHALNLPGGIPEDPGWDTWWDRTTPGTCAGATWKVYAVDTTACRDFNAAEKTAQKNAFLAAYTTATFVSDATYTYNCHGYVFDSSNHWGGDPANWLGAVAPCYQVDATGPIYRWGATHSAFAGGGGLPYLGKCGREIRCNHDTDVYGAHTNRWRQRAGE